MAPSSGKAGFLAPLSFIAPFCPCTFQEADLAVAPLTVTATREQAVEMSTPFMQTGLSFLLHKDVAYEEHHLGFLSPFSMEMWIGVLIAFLITGFCVFLVAR